MPRRSIARKQQSTTNARKQQQQPKQKRNRQPMSMGPITVAPQETTGEKIGKFIGGKAQQLFSKITGLGDYKVDSNTLVDSNGPPIMRNGKRVNLIRHREYIMDITGSTAFNLQSFELNPGLPGTFPWLADVAQNYEEFKFHGLVFEFKSTSADALNSTNTALGTVIMATEYDLAKSPFTSKMAMENYEFASACKPSCSMLHPVECDPRETPINTQYVRSSVNTVYDKRFTDLGLFQIATVGMQAAAVIGELWVTYEVELLKPRLSLLNAVSSNFVNNYTSGNINSLIVPGTLVSSVGDNNFRSLFTVAPAYGSSATLTWTNQPDLAGRTIRLLWHFSSAVVGAAAPGWSVYSSGGTTAYSSLPNINGNVVSGVSEYSIYADFIISSASGYLGFNCAANSFTFGVGQMSVSLIA